MKEFFLSLSFLRKIVFTSTRNCMYISGERKLMNTLMHVVLDPYEALPDSTRSNMKNNAENCLLNIYSDCCSRSFAARGTHMLWIFVGLIYIIYVTSTDTTHLNNQSVSVTNKVNEKIRCANIWEGSSLTTREGMLPDNENLTLRT